MSDVDSPAAAGVTPAVPLAEGVVSLVGISDKESSSDCSAFNVSADSAMMSSSATRVVAGCTGVKVRSLLEESKWLGVEET